MSMPTETDDCKTYDTCASRTSAHQLPSATHARHGRRRRPAAGAHPRVAPARRWLLAVIVAGLPLLQGAQCTNPLKSVNDSVEGINATLSQAVQTLGDQSSAWQVTLRNLETQLASDASGLARQVAEDVQGLIAQVDVVVKDGVQFVQESINCQVDIFASHAKIALQNILIDFLNKWHYKDISNRPRVRHAPIVCSANPSGVNVATWNLSNFLVLSGTDLNLLDTESPLVVVVRSDGSEAALSNMGNRVTNYRFEVNVPSMIAHGQLVNAVQLQIRWNGQRVNRNEIPVVSCGMLGGPCCGGSCTQGSCINGVCSRCGGLGEACCPSATGCLASNTGCSAGRCVTCPAPPARRLRFGRTRDQVGPHCGGRHESRTYAGHCTAGFRREDVQPRISVVRACDVCTARPSWASPDVEDCTLSIRYDTPSDCTKFIEVDIEIWETQITGPRPAGCS